MLNIFKSKTTQQVEISPSIVVFSVLFILGIWFLFVIHNILMILFLAFIIMVALNPGVTKLEKKYKIPRLIAMVIVYLFVISCFVGLIGLVVPPLASQLYQLLRTVDIPLLQDQLKSFSFSISEVNQLMSAVGNSVGTVFSVVSSTFSGILSVFTLIVMSFYLMLDRPRLHQKVAWFTNDKSHIDKTKFFLESLEKQLGGWVRGQIILMIIIGSFTYVGLSLLSIPYALPLAIMAGLLEILPNIGPTLSAIPAIIIAFVFVNPVMALVVFIFYVLVQQLENNIIVPKIMKDNADVNPLIAILTIIIGFQLEGVIGALLAVPTYIMLRAFYSIWIRKHI